MTRPKPPPFLRPHYRVTRCGRICFKRRKVNLSRVFAGQNVGVTQVAERIWLVTFMHFDLGYVEASQPSNYGPMSEATAEYG